MSVIDYLSESEKYKPRIVTKLLIAESPPPSRKKYFYVPRKVSTNKPIRKDTSLSATIFYHYFKKRPKTKEEYTQFLTDLQSMGVFLMDIADKPIRIRDRKRSQGINEENLKTLIGEIPKLRAKIKSRRVVIEDKDITFLLARQHYLKVIRKEFPNSEFMKWIDFRMNNNCII